VVVKALPRAGPAVDLGVVPAVLVARADRLWQVALEVDLLEIRAQARAVLEAVLADLEVAVAEVPLPRRLSIPRMARFPTLRQRARSPTT